MMINSLHEHILLFNFNAFEINLWDQSLNWKKKEKYSLKVMFSTQSASLIIRNIFSPLFVLVFVLCDGPQDTIKICSTAPNHVVENRSARQSKPASVTVVTVAFVVSGRGHYLGQRPLPPTASWRDLFFSMHQFLIGVPCTGFVLTEHMSQDFPVTASSLYYASTNVLTRES